MKLSSKRNAIFIAMFAVILIMSATLVCLNLSAVSADAADQMAVDGSISIGHITDTHYYPFRLGYYGDAVDTDDVNYFYNYVMDKCTKLWVEAAAALDASLKKFTENVPDYIFLSGDIGQDGELWSHIDMGNRLRALQNYIRANGKPDFQIFVVAGNHDLYNPDSYRFDNENGMRKVSFYTSRLEAAKIYAGLGYPNMTHEEAEEFYGPIKDQLPDYGSYGDFYVESYLSHDFTYTWQFLTDGEDGEEMTFDPEVYGDTNLTMAKLMEEGLVEIHDNSGSFNELNEDVNVDEDGDSYSYTYFRSGDDLDIGQMSGMAVRKDGKFTAIYLDVIQSNAVEGHVLGGQVQYSTVDWMDANYDFAHPMGKQTILAATAHHSILPHWDMEEEITTGFILYNWQEMSDYMANYGIRYAYTGHQHANDTTAQVTYSGNQIIDMESSANASAGSQVKITTVEYGMVSGDYAENAYLRNYVNKEIVAENLYNRVFKGDPYGYVARNNVKEFINDNTKGINNYSRYAQRRVYDNIVTNYLDKFLKLDITEKVGDIVNGLSFKVAGLSITFGEAEAKDVVTVANNLIQEINTKILADYTYKGSTERFKAANMKIFGYLEEMVYSVLDAEIVPDTTVFAVFLESYMRHNVGDNWDSVNDMPEEYVALLEKVKSGEFVGFLFDTLLSRENGLMRIIEGLCNTTMDLSKGVGEDLTNLINLVCSMFKLEGVSLSSFNLSEIVKKAAAIPMVAELLEKLPMEVDLVNMTIPEVIDDIVAKYLTDNFKQGLGEYAYNILMGFGVDGDRIDVKESDNKLNGGKGYLLTVPGRSAQFTFVDKSDYKEIITIENGKLPSMLTTNFGSDPMTSEAFTWFTDRRVTDGAIEYTTDLTSKHANAVKVDAKTEIYGTTKGLIDLGIWCQAGYLELSRHTVTLTGLKADTTYAYRAGSPTKGYWSDWYTFTTASEKGNFEVLIASDLQASTLTAYQRADAIYKDILDKEFKNGVSFVINPGDLVDNSRNLTQFEWALNSSRDVYANYAMVIAAGNHDNKYFDLSKAKNADYYVVSKNAVVGEYNYLSSHYNYALKAAQNQATGFYYSFDYSDVHFTVLNTNDIETTQDKDGNNVSQLGKAQYDWLVNDLKTTDKTYKVVVMHKGLYSEGSHSYDTDVIGLRAQLTPLFAEQKVNLAIAGHDHVYNETYYLDANGNKINTDANGKNEIGVEGTLYVTMGTMGEKFYNYVENDIVPTQSGEYLHKAGKLSDPTFGKLVLEDGKLYYYGYQYLRESNTVKPIEKGSATDTALMNLIAIVLVAISGVVIVLSVIVSIVKAAKNKKGKKAKK